MCQVHTGAYVSLLAPEKPTIPQPTQERVPRTHYTYSSSTYHYAYARQTPVNWKKRDKDKKTKRKKYTTPVENRSILARLEVLRKAGCVVHYFEYKRGHVSIFV